MLNPEQVNEWRENPVTLELKRLVEIELDLTQRSKANAYSPFDAQKTQEILAGLNGCEDTWGLILEALDGDWDYFKEEENESSSTIESEAEE